MPRRFIIGMAVVAALQTALLPVGGALSASAAVQDRSVSDIAGVVRSADGYHLPGAAVVITNSATGRSRTVRSDEQGAFRATGLPAGTYSISVSLNGYRTLRYEGMELAGGGRAQLDAQLDRNGQ